MEGPKFGLFVHVGGQNDDRQEYFWKSCANRLQNRDTIHVWHDHIEQDQVRLKEFDGFESKTRVADALDPRISGFGKQHLEECDIRRLVVDDEDLHCGIRCRVRLPIRIDLFCLGIHVVKWRSGGDWGPGRLSTRRSTIEKTRRHSVNHSCRWSSVSHHLARSRQANRVTRPRSQARAWEGKSNSALDPDARAR